MRTQKEAENIVDSILLNENGNDNFVCISWYTQDLEYGWLTSSNLKSYRDSKDETKRMKRYGGMNFIVDKTGEKIWKIPATFFLIKEEIKKYSLIKELGFDKLIDEGNFGDLKINNNIELLEFCVENSYSDEFRKALKSCLMRVSEDTLEKKAKIFELIKKIK